VIVKGKHEIWYRHGEYTRQKQRTNNTVLKNLTAVYKKQIFLS